MKSIGILASISCLVFVPLLGMIVFFPDAGVSEIGRSNYEVSSVDIEQISNGDMVFSVSLIQKNALRKHKCDRPELHKKPNFSSYLPTSLNNMRTDESNYGPCLLYTSPSPRDATLSRMPSSA